MYFQHIVHHQSVKYNEPTKVKQEIGIKGLLTLQAAACILFKIQRYLKGRWMEIRRMEVCGQVELARPHLNKQDWEVWVEGLQSKANPSKKYETISEK
jgi:hypothetical protein